MKIGHFNGLLKTRRVWGLLVVTASSFSVSAIAAVCGAFCLHWPGVLSTVAKSSGTQKGTDLLLLLGAWRALGASVWPPCEHIGL